MVPPDATDGSAAPIDRHGPSVAEEINVALIVLLAAMILVTGYVSWRSRPSGAVPPVIPHNLHLSLTGLAAAVGSSATLTHSRGADNNVVLTLQNLGADLAAAVPSPTGSAPAPAWALYVSDPGNQVPCRYPTHFTLERGGAEQSAPVTPPERVIPPQIDPGNPVIEYLPADPANTFLFVQVCWRSGGPVSLDGPFLSAQVPPIHWVSTTPSLPAPQIDESLAAGTANTSQFAIQSSPTPTHVTDTAWWWAPDPVGRGTATTTYSEVFFSATDVATTQQENQKVF